MGGPVEPGGHVVADEDHAGAAVRRRAGLPAHAQRGAEGVEPLFHQSLSHLLRAHVRLVDHQEFTQRIVSSASMILFLPGGLSGRTLTFVDIKLEVALYHEESIL